MFKNINYFHSIKHVAPMSVEAKLRAQQQAGGESKIASKRTSGSETLLQRRNSNKGDIGNGAASPLTGPAPTNAQKRMSTVPKRSSTSTNAQKTSSSKVLVFPNTIELLKDYPTKIEPATDNINIVHADLKIKYGYFSQRGYYPDGECIFYKILHIVTALLIFILYKIFNMIMIEPDKNNQDSFSITSACVKNKADSEAHKLYIGYYGVYDGHGKQGDLVSYYTRDNVSIFFIYIYIYTFIYGIYHGI